MSDSSDFTPDEWKLLQRAPLLVFYYVAKADGTVDASEVERLIELLDAPERYKSAVFEQVAHDIMSDPKALAESVKTILSETDIDASEQFGEIQRIVDTKLNPADAVGFKEAITDLGVDIAAAKGDDTEDIPLSKAEWSEVAAFRKMLKLA